MQSLFRLPPQKTYAIPHTPFARSWAKLTSCKNVMKRDVRTVVRTDVRRTCPRAIPCAVTMKNYQYAV